MRIGRTRGLGLFDDKRKMMNARGKWVGENEGAMWCGAHAPYTFCRCSEFLSTLERCPLSRPLIGISTSVLSILQLPHLIVYGTRPLSGSAVISARGARNHKASSPLSQDTCFTAGGHSFR